MRQLLPLVFLAPLISNADPLTIHENYVQNPACSSPTGAIDIWVSGGTPPYTYAWSNFTTDEDALGLGPGYIEVTVTDAMSAQAIQGWTLMAVPLSSPSSAQDGHASCIGQVGGEVQVIEWGINGTPPYNYDPSPAGIDPQGEPFFYFPFAPLGTQVAINVTDAEGCSGVVYETITGPQPVGGPVMVLQAVQGSCSGGSGGAATITNVYDGNFFSGPEVTLFDPLQQGTYYGTSFNTTLSFNGLAPGHYYVSRNWDPSGYIMAFPCPDDDTLGFDIPDLGVACGTVSGDVFIDNDQNCAQGGGEVNVPQLVLQIEPGGIYAITDAYGHYSVDLGNGSYTLAQDDASLVQICPAAAPVPFTMASNAQIIDLADSSTIALDLQALIASGAAHPGFAMHYTLMVRNNTPQVSGDVFLTMDFDASVLSYTSASVVPTSVAGDVIMWDLPPMTAYAQKTISVDFLVPVATPLGTPISANIHVTNTLPESDVTNNVAATSTIVTSSFDPNEKVARTSTGYSDTQFFIDADEWIDYTIRFQNTGTASAVNVVVTDTLSDALDMAAFQQGAASRPFSVTFKPGRVVEWTFTDILLPDSGANEAASHGLVAFRIRPAQPLLPGTIISNAANIFFDFNDPVITEPSVMVAEFSAGADESATQDLKLFPNPVRDLLRVYGIDAGHPIRSWDVIAMDGRRVARGIGSMVGMGIDVRSFAPGTYLLQLVSDGDSRDLLFIKSAER